jgi:hypothetical protein
MDEMSTQEQRPNELETVARFGVEMRKQMEAHANKGHWGQLTPAQVVTNIRQQIHEAEQALGDFTNGKVGADELLKKCVHGANYFMILADNAKVLPAVED